MACYAASARRQGTNPRNVQRRIMELVPRYHFSLSRRQSGWQRRNIVSLFPGGYIGLIPIDIEVGDIVCVLFGCPMPVIMRPVDDYFVFIGVAYFYK